MCHSCTPSGRGRRPALAPSTWPRNGKASLLVQRMAGAGAVVRHRSQADSSLASLSLSRPGMRLHSRLAATGEIHSRALAVDGKGQRPPPLYAVYASFRVRPHAGHLFPCAFPLPVPQTSLLLAKSCKGSSLALLAPPTNPSLSTVSLCRPRKQKQPCVVLHNSPRGTALAQAPRLGQP